MMTLLTLLVCIAILVGAITAVSVRNPVSAVIAAGLSSLFAAVSYVILAAPDVAMTEASIGSGLATAIFFYALYRTREHDSANQESTADE